MIIFWKGALRAGVLGLQLKIYLMSVSQIYGYQVSKQKNAFSTYQVSVVLDWLGQAH